MIILLLVCLSIYLSRRNRRKIFFCLFQILLNRQNSTEKQSIKSNLNKVRNQKKRLRKKSKTFWNQKKRERERKDYARAHAWFQRRKKMNFKRKKFQFFFVVIVDDVRNIFIFYVHACMCDHWSDNQKKNRSKWIDFFGINNITSHTHTFGDDCWLFQHH